MTVDQTTGQRWPRSGPQPFHFEWMEETLVPQVGGSWGNKALMPEKRRLMASAFVDGKLYASGGSYSGTKKTTTWSYDPATDTWDNTLAALPTALEGAGSHASLNGHFHFVGGKASSYVTTHYAYDPTADSWTTKAAIPAPAAYYGGASLNDKYYVVGGASSSGVVSSVWVYDPDTDSWSSCADYPVANFFLAAASDGEYIYACGGQVPKAATLYRYDPVSDAWTTLAPMPAALSGHKAEFGDDGRLYVAGGVKSGDVDTVLAYDPFTDSWDETLPNLLTVSSDGTFENLGEGLFYCGGISVSDETNVAGLLEVVGTQPHPGWAEFATLPDGERYGHGATTAGGKLYVAGGYVKAAAEPAPEPVVGAYAAAVMADNPGVYFTMGEDSGDFHSQVVVSTVAAAVGSISRVSDDIPTGSDGSVDFTPGGHLTMTRDASWFDGGLSRTWEAWIKMPAIPSRSISIFGRDSTVASVYANGRLIYQPSGIFYFSVYSTAGGYLGVTSPPMTEAADNKWHHIAATYTIANGPAMYVDGVLVASDNTKTGSPNNDTANILVGANSSESGFLGQISDAAIYPTALTAEQIAAHYNAAVGGSSAPEWTGREDVGWVKGPDWEWDEAAQNADTSSPPGWLCIKRTPAGDQYVADGGYTSGQQCYFTDHYPGTGAEGGPWGLPASQTTTKLKISTTEYESIFWQSPLNGGPIVGTFLLPASGSTVADPNIPTPTITDTIWEYDPDTTTWTAQTPLPQGADACPAMFAEVDGYIYWGGGVTAQDQVWRLNLSNGNWVQKTSMPNSRQGGEYSGDSSAVQDKLIYVAGGKGDANDSTFTLWRYNPDTDNWKVMRDLPNPRADHATVTYRDKLFVVGGASGGNPQSEVLRYNPDTDQWKHVADLPEARKCLAAATAGDKIYAYGGSTSSTDMGNPTDTVWIFDGDTGEWAEDAHPPLPQPVSGLVGTHLQGRVLITGGTGVAVAAPEPESVVLTFDTPATTYTPPNGFGLGSQGAPSYASLSIPPPGGNLNLGGNGVFWHDFSSESSVEYSAVIASVGVASEPCFVVNYIDTLNWIRCTPSLGKVEEYASAFGASQDFSAVSPTAGDTFHAYLNGTTWTFELIASDSSIKWSATYTISSSTLATGSKHGVGRNASTSGSNPWDEFSIVTTASAPTTSPFETIYGSEVSKTDDEATKTMVPGPFEGQLWPRGFRSWRVEEVVSGGDVIDLTSWAWSDKAPLTPGRHSHAAHSVNGKMYIIGGSNITPVNNASFSDVLEYDPTSDSWATKTAMAASYARFAASGVIGGKIYIAGGVTAQSGGYPTNLLQCYDPASDGWSQLAVLPEKISSNCCGSAVVGGKLYVAGGISETKSTSNNKLYCYDPVANAWTEKALLPKGLYNAYCLGINGLLYVFNGQNASGSNTTSYVYNPATDSWSTVASIPHSTNQRASATDGAKAYILDGSNNNTFVYDPQTDVWSTAASANEAPFPGLVYLSGSLFATGGTSSLNQSKSVEVTTQIVSESTITHDPFEGQLWP